MIMTYQEKDSSYMKEENQKWNGNINQGIDKIRKEKGILSNKKKIHRIVKEEN